MKKIKVRILEKVTNWNFDGKTYKAGDVLTIPPDNFVPYIMEKIEAKPKKAKPVEVTKPVEEETVAVASDEQATTEETQETQPQEPTEKPEETSISKKKSSRKKP